MSWGIEYHLGEAKRIAKGTPLPLYFTDEAEHDWRFLAKLVSKNLKGGKQVLLKAADTPGRHKTAIRMSRLRLAARSFF